MQTPSASPAALSIVTARGEPKIISMEKDRYVIGRAESNELSFPTVQGLSRKHLVFEHEGQGWLVRDLGSTNGTFVNGVRVTEPKALRSNDRISAGDLTIVFSESGATRSNAPLSSVVFVEKPISQETATMQVTLETVLSTDPELQGSPHMRALIQAGRELCAQNSLDDLFEVIMNLSVDAVGAPRGALVTIEDTEFRVRASRGAGFRISSHVRDLVVKERRSLLVTDALSDNALAAHLSIVREQVRGILAVPLQTERQVLGLIYLDSPIFVKAFTKDDLNVLTVLANIAAIRIEQARLAEIEQAEKVRAREMEHAALIQRSMLPDASHPFPNRTEFQLHAAMAPAKEVGGDFFDFFLLDQDHLAFVIGDVSGKGVPAALFMAVTRTLLRATAHSHKEPGECFTYMNTTLAEGNTAGMFVTLFYGILNTRTGDLVYANAGHNPPYIFSREGGLRKLTQKSGPMLGVLEGPLYRTIAMRISPREGILLYTDGVTEALDKDSQFFGDAGLERYLAACGSVESQPLVEGLQSAVQEFSKGMPQADDITFLALRYLGDHTDKS